MRERFIPPRGGRQTLTLGLVPVIPGVLLLGWMWVPWVDGRDWLVMGNFRLVGVVLVFVVLIFISLVPVVPPPPPPVDEEFKVSGTPGVVIREGGSMVRMARRSNRE